MYDPAPTLPTTARMLTVRAGRHTYPVVFDAVSRLDRLIRRTVRAFRFFVITNPVILRRHGPRLRPVFRALDARILMVPDGEAFKTYDRAFDLHTRLITAGADRDSVIVALGGGVIGDLAGFVAATYMRGVPLVMAPTTLLAMVDSSVGGKVAVNHPLAKNIIGVFHQPSLVLTDTAFLDTLPDREYLAGLAEVFKYGLAVDASFFQWLRKHQAALMSRGPVVRKAIRESVRLKAGVVAKDEKDAGRRMILNFGHTFGHALESAGGFSAIRHGEAVWIGMLAASYLSLQAGLIGEDDLETILMTIERPLAQVVSQKPVRSFLRRVDAGDVIRRMDHDKKKRDGRLRLVLLRDIGKAGLFEWHDRRALRQSLAWALNLLNERSRP